MNGTSSRIASVNQPPILGQSPLDNVQSDQELIECQNMALEVSWLRRLGKEVSSMIDLTQDHGPYEAIGQLSICEMNDVLLDIASRKEYICIQASKLLRSQSRGVQEAAHSVAFELMTSQTLDSTENSFFESTIQELKSFVESCKVSGKIDLELLVREYLLCNWDNGDRGDVNLHQEVDGYERAFQRYIERLNQIDDRTFFHQPSKDVTSPFMGNPILLRIRMQHTAHPERKDHFGRNLLQVALDTETDCASIIDNPHRSEEDLVRLIGHCDEGGRTSLHIAASRGINCFFRKLQDLPRSVFDPILNRTDNKHSTVLMYAAFKGHYQIVSILLNRFHADSSTKDSCGRNALHYAVKSGHETVIRELVRHNPDLLNAGDHNGYTSFHIGILTGRIEIIRVLLSFSQLDVNKTESTLHSPLAIASEHGHDAIMGCILGDARFSRESINSRDAIGATGLWYAAKYGHLEAVKLLIFYGADAGIANSNGVTPCDAARERGYTEMVAHLEKHLPVPVGRDWGHASGSFQPEEGAMPRHWFPNVVSNTSVMVPLPSLLSGNEFHYN
ncbi:uncharacterized protein JN550_001599 [Neoarthrinium moseri]|uniref:uncharacterized protein n=1 Tax=Neoarthrinium moseri TaxID=1658444 RepID=UPI001FDC2E1D|nr:uncharacterized protein JN550_001599 [Neoarthrinium moseri]KAI1876103.1 hypothetical protein JN550_001599 [Neoarthrinium moseri]